VSPPGLPELRAVYLCSPGFTEAELEKRRLAVPQCRINDSAPAWDT
jgi:hypothetical protein